MNNPLSKTILVLAPHTDDGEFGCGATLAKYLEQGYRVVYAAFSTCENISQPGFPDGILREEVKSATKFLGIQELRIFDYKVRYFSDHRQEILDDMVKLNREFSPELVFAPASTDIHQDHQVVFSEAVRAFKRANFLGYELPWNNIVMTTHCFSKLEETHVKMKADAIRIYKSQQFRNYYSEEFVRSLAFTRGIQAGCQYAEAFEVIRWIM